MANNEYKPDCGYAWVVVAACFTINFIMAGLARAAGVLYIALIDVYSVSREVATTPFSIRFCVRNLSGPAVGALGQRFGIRPVVILGGLICGLGAILSALAPDVTWLTAAWGGIHGLGYGMCNLIHVIVLSSYFHKYKGLALGVCLTGDCFGTFLLPLLLELLLSVYDLRGTFLILAGISLNVVPAAMLLKSPSWERRGSTSSFISENKYIADTNSKDYDQGIRNKGFDNTSEELHIKHTVKNVQYILPTITINEPESKENYSESQKTVNDIIKQLENAKEADTDICFNDRYKNKLLIDTLLLNDIHTLRESISLRLVDKSMKKKRFSCNFSTFNKTDKDRRTSAESVLSCPSYVGTSWYKNNVQEHIPYKPSPYLHSIKCPPYEISRERQNSFIQHEQVENNEAELLSNGNSSGTNEKAELKQTNIPTVLYKEERLTELKLNEEENATGSQGNAAISDVSTVNPLLKFIKTNIKPIFLVICATMALYVFLFISVFTIIIDYAADHDIPSEYGKYLIIAFSVTDLFGRIGFGIVLDKKCIALSHFAAMTVGLMGFFVLIIPFYACFTFWMVSFSLCGFVQGGAAIMFPLLVVHYMNKDEESVALGCLNFYGGILMFPIPPMIGYFRDHIGSYDGVFWTVGGLCMFAASLWIFEPCLVLKQKKEFEATRISEENKI